nr:hypothetical protein [Streptomyces olivoreticuli]
MGDLVVHHPVALGESADYLGPAAALGEHVGVRLPHGVAPEQAVAAAAVDADVGGVRRSEGFEVVAVVGGELAFDDGLWGGHQLIMQSVSSFVQGEPGLPADRYIPTTHDLSGAAAPPRQRLRRWP